jgi:hypothetical protein
MPRPRLSPEKEARRSELRRIKADSYFPNLQIIESGSYYPFLAEQARHGYKPPISQDDLARFLYHRQNGGQKINDISIPMLRDLIKKDVYENFLREYGLDPESVRLELGELLDGVTIDNVPLEYRPVFIRRAEQLGLPVDDLVRSYFAQNNIEPGQPFDVRPSEINALTFDRVLENLRAVGRTATPLSPTSAAQSMPPIEEVLRNPSVLRERTTENPNSLRAILKQRENELKAAEAESSGLLGSLSNAGAYPSPDLIGSINKAQHKQVMAEAAARAAAKNLADVENRERNFAAQRELEEVLRRQPDASSEPPPFPEGSSIAYTNMHPAVAQFQKENVAAVRRELAHPYRPFTGERVAALDPLQKFAQEQAKAVHAREKGMSELYNKSAQAIEGTLGERSLDTMKPYLDAGLKDPSTEWERFRSPHDREFEGIKEQLERNLTEHILPAINSRYSVRSGHRNKFTQRALRDFSESLNKEKSALMERDIRDAKKMAAEYAGRQLNAAQLVGGTHTTDVSRISDTARALHGLGSREQERALQGANTLSNIGAQNQAQRQQEINAAINAHKEAQEHGLRVRALGTSIVGGLPVNESILNVMQPAQTASPNPLTQAGGLMAALGAMNYANLGRSSNYRGGAIRNSYKNGGRARFEEGGAVGGNPFQRGVDNALESIRRHKESLENISMDMDRPGPNPIWPWIAKTGLGVAASRNPNALQAIGEAGLNAFDAYENTIKLNMLQKERAANIHEAIIKTHQIEEDNRLKRKLESDKLTADLLKQFKTDAYRKAQLTKPHHNTVTGQYFKPKLGSPTEDNPYGQIEGVEILPGSPTASPVVKKIEQDALGRAVERSELATEDLHDIKRMNQIKGDIGYTGPATKIIPEAVEDYVTTLGSDKKLANRGEFKSLFNKQLARITQSQKGAQSDNDMKIWASIKPNFEMSEGAISQVLSSLEEAKTREEAFGEFSLRMAEAGVPLSKVRKAFKSWANSNPILDENMNVHTPKDDPEDYLDEQSKAKIAWQPKEFEDEEVVVATPKKIDIKSIPLEQRLAEAKRRGLIK